jgi:hypothetical protein
MKSVPQGIFSSRIIASTLLTPICFTCAIHLYRKIVWRSDGSVRRGNIRSQSHSDGSGYQRAYIGKYGFQGRVRVYRLAPRNVHDLNRSTKPRVGRKKRYRARCQPGSEPQLHAIPQFGKQQRHGDGASPSPGYWKCHLGNGCHQRIRPGYSVTGPQFFRPGISCRWCRRSRGLRNSRFVSVRNELRFQRARLPRTSGLFAFFTSWEKHKLSMDKISEIGGSLLCPHWSAARSHGLRMQNRFTNTSR